MKRGQLLNFLIFGVLLIPAVISKTYTFKGHHRLGRIVSLSPAITEILFALNLGHRVIGVTDYCNYPPKALEKPKVGGFMNPNLEVIVSLSPDLVIASSHGGNKNTIHQLKELGIKVLEIDYGNINELFKSFLIIGKATGNLDQAKHLKLKLRSALNRITNKIAGVSYRPKVLFIVGQDPLIVAGRSSFINELIGIAGGENIGEDIEASYARFSLEEIINRGPEIIFLPSKHGSNTMNSKERLKDVWKQWTIIPAIRNEKIYEINGDFFFRPGPRIIQGLEGIAKFIHPEMFQEKMRSANGGTNR